MPNKAQITEAVNGQIVNTPINGVVLVDATGEGSVKTIPVNGQMTIADFFALAGVQGRNVAASVNGTPAAPTTTVNPGDRVTATPSNVKGALFDEEQDGPSDDVVAFSGARIAD